MIKWILLGIAIVICAVIIVICTCSAKIKKQLLENLSNDNKRLKKRYSMYYLLLKWVEIEQQNKSFAAYFQSRNIRRVAIYGMGELGMLLCNGLITSNAVEITYAMDSKLVSDNVLVPIRSKDDKSNPEVDAIIVTPIFAYSGIKKDLEKIYNCPIINLEELIYSL